MSDPTADDLKARLNALATDSKTLRKPPQRISIGTAILAAGFISLGTGMSVGYAIAPAAAQSSVLIEKSGWEWLVLEIAQKHDVLPNAAERILTKKLGLQYEKGVLMHP
ncbi:hypothetical protein [Thalassovita aquimarina]|uniref:Uncharacterized protein n=1 Tax=Thalassovita aquimarina TaxID=2785917 RepID=A0ABS5HSD3_9RHOB|nr:hypothetical protein [Thalassovita aquimarina]MBR9651891.1 hypothetical protein [Thalassovita aquimarina]